MGGGLFGCVHHIPPCARSISVAMKLWSTEGREISMDLRAFPGPLETSKEERGRGAAAILSGGGGGGCG